MAEGSTVIFELLFAFLRFSKKQLFMLDSVQISVPVHVVICIGGVSVSRLPVV
jgi:hypothetical protein